MLARFRILYRYVFGCILILLICALLINSLVKFVRRTSGWFLEVPLTLMIAHESVYVWGVDVPSVSSPSNSHTGKMKGQEKYLWAESWVGCRHSVH